MVFKCLIFWCSWVSFFLVFLKLLEFLIFLLRFLLSCLIKGKYLEKNKGDFILVLLDLVKKVFNLKLKFMFLLYVVCLLGLFFNL